MSTIRNKRNLRNRQQRLSFTYRMRVRDNLQIERLSLKLTLRCGQNMGLRLYVHRIVHETIESRSVELLLNPF